MASNFKEFRCSVWEIKINHYFAHCLFIFGAKKLPEIGKGLGKSIREFKSSISGEEEQEDPAKPKEEKKDSPKPTP
jgi:TatA/E family protein of Tat protein translocase